MSVLEDIGDSAVSIFGSVGKRELSSVEKVQEIEELVRECARDLAFSRDEIYIESLQENTIVMVRAGETHLKKFKSGDNMYVSIPETTYDNIEKLSDFDKYNEVMDLLKLSLAATEYREKNEDGDMNFIEAEIIDNASKKYEDKTGSGLDVEYLIERDEFGSAVSMKDEKEMFEPKRYSAKDVDSEDDGDEDDKAAKEALTSETTGTSSTGACDLQKIDDEVKQEQKEMQEMQVNQDFQAQYVSQSITDTEQKVVDEIKDSTFFVGRYEDQSDYESYAILNKKTIVELDRKVKEIAKSLQGHNGKVKRITPSKRLSSKDICNDNSERIYVGKSYVDGKHIDMNIISEFSGSMGGSPASNAVKIIYIFNKLAQQGYVSGNILLTESSETKFMKMPIHDDVIKAIGGTGGAEGIQKGINKYRLELSNRNAIIMTDGDICEEPIDPKFWEKNKIHAIGMYVNEDVKFEDLPGYDKNLSRWFPKSIIRNSLDEAIHKITQLGLRASKKGD